jgi:uncharacterized protein DUF3592
VSQDKNTTVSPKTGRWFGCLGLILNLLWIVLLAAGLLLAYSSWRLTTRGKSVEGTVVKMISSEDSDGVTYAPVVEYEANGNTYSYESSSYSSPPAFHVGQQVKMIYDGEHPDQARISNFVELWLAPLIMIPFGLGDAAVTFYLMRVLSRRKAA